LPIERDWTCGLPLSAAAFAVEKAMKMSPDPCPHSCPSARGRAPPLGDAFQLVRKQCGRGGDDDDDRFLSPFTGAASALSGSSVRRVPAMRSVSRTGNRSDQGAHRACRPSATRRDAVPMPHLKSWQVMPVPPLTAFVDRLTSPCPARDRRWGVRESR
jgi:hypothetical protein